MKTLITTAAILAATASIASANPANNSSDTLAEELAAANAEISTLTTQLQTVTGKYHSLSSEVEDAENAPYVVKGDIFKLVKGTADYEARNASYDPGSSATTFSKDITNGNEILSNVTLSGKYHNFTINTDITVNSMSDKIKLQTLVHVINDKAYNEGYKDGFNDGYEIGFNNGYKKAVNDIRTADTPL